MLSQVYYNTAFLLSTFNTYIFKYKIALIPAILFPYMQCRFTTINKANYLTYNQLNNYTKELYYKIRLAKTIPTFLF
jgi:hypothetical protein